MRVGERVMLEGVIVGVHYAQPDGPVFTEGGGLAVVEVEHPTSLDIRVRSLRTDNEAASVRPGLSDGDDVSVRLS
jgi:hypothetical protein